MALKGAQNVTGKRDFRTNSVFLISIFRALKLPTNISEPYQQSLISKTAYTKFELVKVSQIP